MANVHKIDNLSVRPRRSSIKHKLIVAEQVALFVALPMFAVGCYVGYKANAAAQSQIQQAVKAATATPTPTPSK